ncbi:MAG: FHA domain-containing protein [Myxococcaceae bacterium]|nr:FHA domain-containing protein [Myxococcaceae bacterium]
MADPLLSWINRMLDDPKTFDAQLKNRSVLVYEPHRDDEDSSSGHRLRTSSGITATVIGQGDPVVAVLEKSKDNVFQRRVTMGRTTNNDIVLDDASVSRFHGWLQQDDGSGKWTLTDAGSKNGTWVQGSKLNAKKPVILENAARVRVGNLELTYYSAAGFRAVIAKRANGSP